MRGILVAGNWKMNLNAQQATALAEGLKARLADGLPLEVALCPPFTYLQAVGTALRGSAIKLGAQNVYPEREGAFTGEISPAMLVDVGCTYVIIGHSERRHVIGRGEDDAFINRKIHAALDAGLLPIFCIGEKLEQRDAGQTNAVLTEQLHAGLAGISAEQMRKIVIAYEPVWAIGTGRNATPEQAQEAHEHIRAVLTELFDKDVAAATTIQYGGSVKPSNASDLLAQSDVDGALVGGASLKLDDFVQIVEAAAAAKGVV